MAGERDNEPAAILVLLPALGLLVGFTVWIGAQIAALLFGQHHLLALTSHDVAQALPGLAREPGRPNLAWPARVRPALPGPVGYWVASAPPLLAGLAATVVIGLVASGVWPGGAGPAVRHRRRMGMDPDDRFATVADLAPLWVGGPRTGRMTLGRVGGRFRRRLVATEDPTRPLDAVVPRWRRRRASRRRGGSGSVVVFGPSQCGKTSALAIPAILEWDGPLIALSVKTDLLGATIARRRRLGEVRVFDPTGITGGQGDAGWSPLATSRRLSGARQTAKSIMNATDWSETGGDMAFWVSTAEDLLGLLFWTAATAQLPMGAVVDWVTGMEKETPAQLLGAFAGHTDPITAAEGVIVRDGFEAVWKSDQRQISSVYLVARQMIRPWQEPAIRDSADTSGISLDWLLGQDQPDGEDGPAGPRSVYLCADLDDADRLAPVLGGLVDDLIREAYVQVGRTGRPLDPKLLVVVDEAGNWPMRNLPARISTCAGLGIQLLLLYQSKAQIDAAYGQRADTVVANAATKIFFCGVSDPATLTYVDSLLGSEHVPVRSTSREAGLFAAGSGSISDQPSRLDLFPASMLRQVLPGQALLIHHTLRPAHLHGRYWFRDRQLRALATSDPERTFQAAARPVAEDGSPSAGRAVALPEPPAVPGAISGWPFSSDDGPATGAGGTSTVQMIRFGPDRSARPNAAGASGPTDRPDTAGGLGDGDVAWLSWPQDLLDQPSPGETQPHDPYGFAERFTTEGGEEAAAPLVAPGEHPADRDADDNGPARP
jgi:type IV secretion system protein VirD4